MPYPVGGRTSGGVKGLGADRLEGAPAAGVLIRLGVEVMRLNTGGDHAQGCSRALKILFSEPSLAGDVRLQEAQLDARRQNPVEGLPRQRVDQELK